MNTYSWKIQALQAYTQHSGKTDVIYRIHWNYVAIDSTETYTVSSVGYVDVPAYVPGNPFIPYQNLDVNTVTGWIESSIGSSGIEQMKAELDQKINDLINPPVVMLPPPWTPTPTPSPTAFPPMPTPTLSAS